MLVIPRRCVALELGLVHSDGTGIDFDCDDDGGGDNEYKEALGQYAKQSGYEHRA